MAGPVKLRKATKRAVDGRFVKGTSGCPGGKNLGIKHRKTKMLEAIFNVFNTLGAEEGLLKWVKESKKNRHAFYGKVMDCLPKTIDVEGEGVSAPAIVIIRPEAKKETEEIIVPKRESLNAKSR